jgi:steroid 5-alpha reductase family enzyme
VLGVLASLLLPGLPSVWAAVAVVVLFLTVWAVSVRIQDVGIVDTFWGLSFVLVALVVALTADGDTGLRWLLLGMTAIWGVRLGAFLLARFRRHDSEDPRYAAIRDRHRDRFALYSLVVIFGTQAVAVLLVSLPIQVAARSDAKVGALVAVGVVLWAVGVAVEAAADEQQRRHSASGDDGVLDTGLWRYSRHPNKFGDACAWWGIWLVACTAGGTWWTLIGPAVMTFVLVRGTGEDDHDTDSEEEAAYVRRTSKFLPLPPRA